MDGIFRMAAMGATLAFGLAFSTAVLAEPTIDQLMAASPDQLRAAIQLLPPEIQNQIRQQLATKSLEELAAMSPEQLGAAIRTLSPAAKAELKAKWAALPADQKAALSSANLKALWQQAVARFRAMGPAERAMLKKLLGEVTGAKPEGQP